MFSGSLRLGKVAGIQVSLDFSLLLIAALVVYQIYLDLPRRAPGFNDSVYFIYATIGAVLFFVSILWHEFAHAFMAQFFGYRVRQIVLNVLGGIAVLEQEARRAVHEFWIALSGPVSSAILGGLFLGARFAFDDGSVIGAMFYWLGTINLLLAAFNMLPGFPLDGGIVLRASIWMLSGNHLTASRVASYVGQGMAALLIMFGLGTLFIQGFITGIWGIFIGWFFLSAARLQLFWARQRADLSGVSIGQLVRANSTVNADWSVYYALDSIALRGGTGSAPVVVLRDGRFVGVFSAESLGQRPRHDWWSLRVNDVMTPIESIPSIEANTDLYDALQNEKVHSERFLLVIDQQRPVGFISKQDIIKMSESQP